MAEVFTLGGRLYEPAVSRTTFAQDARLMALLRTHKIDDAIDAEDGDVLGAILASDAVEQFLAAILVEVDGTWTRASADRNAQAFADLTDPAEKAQLLAALEGLLAGFFAGARGSSTVAGSASRPSTGRRGTARRSRAPRPATSAASGPASSPVSPTTTASA